VSLEERTGHRPNGFSEWARKQCQPGMPLYNKVGHIDLDWVFYDYSNGNPLILLEVKHDKSLETNRVWTVTRNLALKAGVHGAMVVYSTASGDGDDGNISGFHVHALRAGTGVEEERDMTADEFLRAILDSKTT
jgi:hypothetical protein